jgi:hypothetical protein
MRENGVRERDMVRVSSRSLIKFRYTLGSSSETVPMVRDASSTLKLVIDSQVTGTKASNTEQVFGIEQPKQINSFKM